MEWIGLNGLCIAQLMSKKEGQVSRSQSDCQLKLYKVNHTFSHHEKFTNAKENHPTNYKKTD